MCQLISTGNVYSKVLERRVRPIIEPQMCFVDLEKEYDTGRPHKSISDDKISKNLKTQNSEKNKTEKTEFGKK